MKVVTADRQGIALAARYLREGKSVVYPTDTAYGLAVDASNPDAVQRLYLIKERFSNQPVHVVVSSLSMAKKIAKFSPIHRAVWKKFMPGPLTLVCDLKLKNQKSWNMLSAGTGTIGIRMPDNKISLSLVRKLGRPITTTSANPSAHLSGGTTPYSVLDSSQQFLQKKYRPDLFLDSGKLRKRKTSSLVRIENNGIITVLRKGVITKKQIQSCIK